MANVLNRSTLDVLYSVNTPDYDSAAWVIDPDTAPVAGVPQKYWKLTGDTLSEMSAGEKATVDASEASTRTAVLKLVIKAAVYPTVEPPITSTVTTSGLVITVDIVDLISNDQTTITASGTDVKHVHSCLVHNRTSDTFYIVVLERTTGSFDNLAADETCVEELGNWSVAVNGTTLVAE